MALWYVDATATGTGSGTSEANAFTTIDAAFNEPTLAAGDTIYVKASATYDETADIVTSGVYNNYILVEGYATTPGDGGEVTWTQSVSGPCLTDTVSTGSHRFDNFHFTGSANNHNISVGGRDTFNNCRFTNAAFMGALTGNNSCCFHKCEFSGNGTYGLYMTSTLNFAVGCTFANNGNSGIYSAVGGDISIYKCLFYGNASSVADVDIISDNGICIGCTFDGGGTAQSAYDVDGYATIFMDNLIHDYTYGYIASETSSMAHYMTPKTHNLFSNVSSFHYYSGSAEIAFISGLYPEQDITGAASFTDEAGADYTLASDSDAIDAGTMPGLEA